MSTSHQGLTNEHSTSLKKQAGAAKKRVAKAGKNQIERDELVNMTIDFEKIDKNMDKFLEPDKREY